VGPAIERKHALKKIYSEPWCRANAKKRNPTFRRTRSGNQW